ncbi:MAG TPA: LacI family DNA-binding transcriptional regulator [Streptosporangiaceae bacterium]|nr:LacI family DNA-binding transcriptional regulator [Streptosporangiaceae bacterium]
MTRKHATVEQVARLAGVSTATVSRVLNGTAAVAADTERRVRDAIELLAFNPAPQARGLRTGRTGNIALIVPSITNPFFPELMAHVSREVRGRGYSMLLFDSPEPEKEGVRVARSRLADGIILVGSTSPAAARPPAEMTDVPVVAFDRRPQALSAPVIQVDNYEGARAVVRHLGERGHRRIVFISGPRGVSVSADRARGYRAGLRDLGIAPDKALTIAGEFDEDSGYAATVRLLRRPAPPAFTALFAANDMMAIGAMSALRDHGVAIPSQVAVAGFDGIHLGRYVAPSLTTYAQPTAELARRAAELLAAAIAGSPAPPARTLRLPGSLIIRDSTAPAAPPA